MANDEKPISGMDNSVKLILSTAVISGIAIYFFGDAMNYVHDDYLVFFGLVAGCFVLDWVIGPWTAAAVSAAVMAALARGTDFSDWLIAGLVGAVIGWISSFVTLIWFGKKLSEKDKNSF